MFGETGTLVPKLYYSYIATLELNENERSISFGFVAKNISCTSRNPNNGQPIGASQFYSDFENITISLSNGLTVTGTGSSSAVIKRGTAGVLNIHIQVWG
ncbi:hypothetical protein D3C73_1196900 [compost metagenome]